MRVWKKKLINGTFQIWISPWTDIEINLGAVSKEVADDNSLLQVWLEKRLKLIKSKI